MFLWLGLGLSVEFTQSIFGAQSTQQIDTDRCGLPVFDNPVSRRVRGVVDAIQKEKPRCMRVSNKEFKYVKIINLKLYICS